MITNSDKILRHAMENGYAIPHFNVVDANFIKNIMVTSNELNSPVIIAVSANTLKYMGGYKTYTETIKAIDEDLNIKVPVIIHLDHGSFESCKIAVDSGFTSVMYDGSKLSIEENIKNTKEILSLASPKNISVEAEVGSIGGEEDGVIGNGDNADIEECKLMSKLSISSLAAGVNTIHGKYPPNWTGVNFELLHTIIKEAKVPVVLHGGSGIPDDQMKKAIKSGISKLNVGTALQVAFGEGVEEYSKNVDKNKDKKWYDPRKVCNSGFVKVNEIVKHVIDITGSANKNGL